VDAIRLVGLLVYTCGAFAYGTVLLFWVRELGRPGWAQRSGGGREVDLANGAMLIVSFIWFCANVAALLLSFGRARLWQLDILTIVLAFAFPPLIMHTTLAQVRQHRPEALAAGWKRLLWPAYAAAVAIPAWCLSIFAAPASPALIRFASQTLGVGLVALFVSAGVYSIAIIGRHDIDRGSRARQERYWVLGLFGLMMLLFLAMLAIGVMTGRPSSRPIESAGGLLEIAAKSLPLVFIFVGAYFENRFDFFDLFVKRGLALVITIGALTVAFALLLPLLQPIENNWAAPWIYAVMLLPLVAALPWLHRRINTILDRRWLGRRFTAVEAVKRFLSGLKSATSQAELAERARESLAEIFGASCIVEMAGANAAAADFAVAHETPIRSGSATVGRFRMGPRASEAPYFRDDIALLDSLADVFASVVDNLHLQERKQEQEQRAQQLSLHASRSELKALRAQINPHFLFNALNAIAGLIHRNPRAADRTIEQLADVFRYALRGAESEWAALGDELEFVQAYLDVERARFGDRLQTDLRLDDDVRTARVPTMVVQTLVENAVKHGLNEIRGAASVRVHARREDDRLVVSVIDNGPGFSASALAATDTVPGARGGYGLVNIRQRLRGYFGADGVLTIDRDAARGETTVSISLPILLDGQGADRATTREPVR
jgi:signal transduction histidine kinase